MWNCGLKVHDSSEKDPQVTVQNLPDSRKPVRIERLVSGGWGMAYQGELVTFVRGVLPGETVILQNFQTRKGYQFAKVKEILEPSSDRIVPSCEMYEACGGCHLQHITYPQQVVAKQAYLLETLQRIGKLPEPPVMAPVVSPQPFDYRSWIRFKVSRWQGHLTLGFFQEKTHDFVPAVGCLLIPEPMKALVQWIEHQLQSLKPAPSFVEELEVRHSLFLDEYLIMLKGRDQHVSPIQVLKKMATGSSVVGVIYSSAGGSGNPNRKSSRTVEGRDYLFEEFQGIRVRISDRSFMQSNWPVFEKIGQTIITWLEDLKETRVLELYAGTGCIGLAIAAAGGFVTLVEANPVALRDARKTASINHIGRSRFRASKAESFLSQLDVGEYDVIFLDPPRSGLTSSVVKELTRLKVPKLVYLSCDAPSLARDVQQLVEGGYHLTRTQAFDLFPQTSHLEVLVELVH